MNVLGSINPNISSDVMGSNRAIERFKAKDTNGDNKLNLGEAGTTKESFDKVDLNKDEQVGLFEAALARRGKINQYFAHQVMNKKDSDGSGSLDMNETSLEENTYNRIDRNNDGLINENELAVGRRILVNHHTTNQIMNNKDTDGDGYLSGDELNISQENFEKIDRNADGKVGELELNAAKRYIARQQLAEVAFSVMDTDENGLLSNEEIAMKEKNFSVVDSNNDEYLDLDELQSVKLRDFPAYTNSLKKEESNESELDLTA